MGEVVSITEHKRERSAKASGWIAALEDAYIGLYRENVPPGWRSDKLAHRKRSPKRAQLEAAYGKPIPSRITPEEARELAILLRRITTDPEKEYAAAGALVPESKRAQFNNAVRRAVDALHTVLQADYDKRLKEAVGEREEQLREREKLVAADEQRLLDARRDITTYMTEHEFNLVLGSLHPDRPDRAPERLAKAFRIFQRLEGYILKLPPSVMKARGWQVK